MGRCGWQCSRQRANLTLWSDRDILLKEFGIHQIKSHDPTIKLAVAPSWGIWTVGILLTTSSLWTNLPPYINPLHQPASKISCCYWLMHRG
ncbi:hypothetical protein XELAEV_18002796mg [Xenopus laevis]|nr:hypothetical protein XELAEV_18002796mg [Xenopus laevis]